MEHYITVSLKHPEQDIILPQPISFNGEAEMGIVDLQMPTSNTFSHMTDKDVVKVDTFTKYKKNHLILVPDKPIDEQINAIFSTDRLKSMFSYEDGCFRANIPSKYFVAVSDALQNDMGMPKRKIKHRVTGKKRSRNIADTLERSEYVYLYYVKQQEKKEYRVEKKYYPTALDVRNAFKALGVYIDSEGKLQKTFEMGLFSFISPTLREKLIQDQPIYQIMLYSNIIE
jgi:hypothetical protein